MSEREFTVGVFPPSQDVRGYQAYTRDYQPNWKGCQVVKVLAENGTQAKRRAIAQVKEQRSEQSEPA